MKRLLVLWLCVMTVTAIIPRVIGKSFARGADTVSEVRQTETKKMTEKIGDDDIKVYIAQTGKTEIMSLRDYIIGVTAAEMPAAFEHDALCAQALASISYALYQKEHGSGELPGQADISTDPAKHQAYCDKEQLKVLWGENFDEYSEKIENAVDEVIAYEITYNGEPTAAVFHAISPGKTESAENMWDADMPYLVSVESEGDSVSPKYNSSLTVNSKEFKSKLNIKTDEKPSEWFGDTEYSEAGTLLSVDILGKTYTGMELRETFGLQSAAIEISCTDDTVTFSVKGYGHGVGLSQYGADYYARRGMTWREIIAHYYPGTEIKER